MHIVTASIGRSLLIREWGMGDVGEKLKPFRGRDTCQPFTSVPHLRSKSEVLSLSLPLDMTAGVIGPHVVTHQFMTVSRSHMRPPEKFVTGPVVLSIVL